MKPNDQLFVIFEQHLLNALVEEESTEEFLNRVVQDYLVTVTENGIIPQEVRRTVEEDLREEVLEMLRKKTYGHYSLKEFRRAKVTAAATTRTVAKMQSPPNNAAAASGKLRMRRPRRSN